MTTPQTPPPVKSSEDYFNSSRLRVIGMITAATVAVGALGGIAGVAFDPDPVPKDHLHQPGGGGAQLAPAPVSGGGNSAPFMSRVPSADVTATPATPGTVGSVSPGSGGLPTPSSGATGGSVGGTGQPTPTGNTGTIEATGVDIYVPDGWTIDNQNENQLYMSNGDGGYAFAFSGTQDASTSAGDLITTSLDDLLPPEQYTQRRTSDIQALDPFGSVVSLAGLEYEALWVDDQGSETIHGQLYVGVRQDGTVLGIEIEQMPADQFEQALAGLNPIVDNSFGRFGGLS